MLGMRDRRNGLQTKTIALSPVIEDKLYLGDHWGACNLISLKLAGFTDILNVTSDLKNPYPSHFAYHRISLVDGKVDYTVSDFEGKDAIEQQTNTGKIDFSLILISGAAFIHQALEDGKKLLVHCKEGLSRSATMCIAYLMIYHDMRYTEAFRHIYEVREIKPHFMFDQALKQLDTDLYSDPENADTLELRTRSIRRTL